MSSIDEQFVEFIVKSLVSQPDAVKIERRIDEKGVLLELTVDPEDLGRVIGKRGATAQSLRTLLRALGTKNDARYNLKIVDNGEPHERRSHDEDRQVAPSHDDDSGNQDDGQPPITNEESTAPASPHVDDDGDDDDLPTKAEHNHDSVISKTRKELEELDDLEV
jgi:predicted RNA-binding protein YlqC (UPF0109 family)